MQDWLVHCRNFSSPNVVLATALIPLFNAVVYIYVPLSLYCFSHSPFHCFRWRTVIYLVLHSRSDFVIVVISSSPISVSLRTCLVGFYLTPLQHLSRNRAGSWGVGSWSEGYEMKIGGPQGKREEALRAHQIA
ncbi:hypothetical protein F4680DRAFT_412324 [Xylaria scruposa]|nr:hypothetical protein F4680DRAFT_412324 [Xylaria scruposa]